MDYSFVWIAWREYPFQKKILDMHYFSSAVRMHDLLECWDLLRMFFSATTVSIDYIRQSFSFDWKKQILASMLTNTADRATPSNGKVPQNVLPSALHTFSSSIRGLSRLDIFKLVDLCRLYQEGTSGVPGMIGVMAFVLILHMKPQMSTKIRCILSWIRLMQFLDPVARWPKTSFKTFSRSFELVIFSPHHSLALVPWRQSTYPVSENTPIQRYLYQSALAKVLSLSNSIDITSADASGSLRVLMEGDVLTFTFIRLEPTRLATEFN